MFSIDAKTEKKIVLLTSFSEEEAKAQSISESYFKFKLIFSATKIKVIHKAKQEELYAYLNDPSVKALFWISHASQGKRSNSPLGQDSLILDYEQTNIAPLFTRFHEGLEFIGIISCRANNIVKNQSKLKASLREIPHYLPRGRVTVKRGIQEAARAYKNRKPRSLSKREESNDTKILIKRASGDQANFSTLRVELNGQFIGLLTPNMNEQEFEFPFHYINNTLSNVIELQSGKPLNQKTFFGEINVMSGDNNEWDLFAKPDGTPFGINKRVFTTPHWKIAQEIL